jgi:hypothetical protein
MLRLGRFTALTAAIGVTLLTSGAVLADPPDPQQVADHAITRMDNIATRSSEAVTQRAAAAATAIDELQAQGEQQQAERLARHALNHVRARSAHAVQEMNETQRRAVRLLQHLEAPAELIEAVQAAAEAGRQTVRAARDAAMETITTALED